MKKHIITALVENQPGVLARVIGLISGRGYNIETLNVGPTNDPTVSRMTMQVPGDNRVLEQVTRQLGKLVDVIAVTDLTTAPCVNQECLMVKLAATHGQHDAITALTERLGGRVLATQPDALIVQLTGDSKQVADYLDLLSPFKVLDIIRSGVIAMAKAV
ncbi:MAG: acetolactate synthase small subunit [bacterium]